MDIRKLDETPFEILLNCFLTSFENYYVQMPDEPEYYRQRWTAAGVRFDLSYGMFDGDKLTGFIIHAVARRNGHIVAHNIGTGVIPDYRGKRIVKSIYEFALQDLKKHGITKCSLEVIKENLVAVRAYKSIGFHICRNYSCYSGALGVRYSAPVESEEVTYKEMDWDLLPGQKFCSWDHHHETLRSGNYRYYRVLHHGSAESYFVINPVNGYLAQFDLFNEVNGSWERLFSAIGKYSATLKIINVDERQKSKLKYLGSTGIPFLPAQYEMQLELMSG